MLLLTYVIGLQFILQIVTHFLMNTGHYGRNLHAQLVNLYISSVITFTQHITPSSQSTGDIHTNNTIMY